MFPPAFYNEPKRRQVYKHFLNKGACICKITGFVPNQFLLQNKSEQTRSYWKLHRLNKVQPFSSAPVQSYEKN